jgi:hypothetical protein
VFEFYVMFLWNGFLCVNMIILTNIYMIKQWNEFFLVKLDLVDCYILKKFFNEEKVTYEKTNVCELKGKCFAMFCFWFFLFCFPYSFLHFVCKFCWRKVDEIGAMLDGMVGVVFDGQLVLCLIV